MLTFSTIARGVIYFLLVPLSMLLGLLILLGAVNVGDFISHVFGWSLILFALYRLFLVVKFLWRRFIL